MNKKNTNIALNSYLPSLLTGLKSNGINPNQFLTNSYLKKLDLYDPNKYIPNILLDNLLISITDKIGVNCLVAEFNNHFKASKMGRVSEQMYQSPNFLSFLECVVKNQKIVRSNYTVKLVINGPVARFSVRVNQDFSRGKFITEEIDISRILDAFMMIGGASFIPIELGITAKTSYFLEPILPRGNYPLLLNQAESWVLFETKLLSKKIPNVTPKLHLNVDIKNNEMTEFKIERLLESFKPGYIPNLNELAEILNVSSRTLERNLQMEGTHFLAIKKRLIRRKSYELLSNPNFLIKEIAEHLGYSNTQNYIRNFKNWNNLSPNKYRQKL